MDKTNWKLLTEDEIRNLSQTDVQDYLSWLKQYKQSKLVELNQRKKKRTVIHENSEQEQRVRDLALIEKLKQSI